MVICKDSVKVWDNRQTETGLQRVALKAFEKGHTPDPSNLQSYYQERQQELEAVIECIPGSNKDKFEATEMVDGFVAWNKYQIEADDSVPMNKKWSAWIAKLKSKYNYDDYSVFIDFFE